MKISKMMNKMYDNLPSFIFTIFLAIFLLGIISGTVKADLNGTELLNDPVNTTLEVFTDFFGNITGNPMNFWIIPLAGVTIGLYANTNEILVPSMFMLASGGLMASGQIFAGMPGVPYVFLIFASIGFTGMFANLYLSRKR